MKELKEKKKTKKVNAIINSYVDSDSFKADPNGSWTGRPENEKEKPVQDADDL